MLPFLWTATTPKITAIMKIIEVAFVIIILAKFYSQVGMTFEIYIDLVISA